MLKLISLFSLVWLVSLVLPASSCTGTFPPGGSASAADTVHVPVGGNSWVTGGQARITNNGLVNWTDSASRVVTYVRFAKPGVLRLSVRLRMPEGKSRLRVTVLDQSRELDVTGSTLADHALGQWPIGKAGYVKISLQGIARTGRVYADVTDLVLGGDAVDSQTRFVPNDEGNFFHWGRRGPSVHLRYPLPEGAEAEWFYNEITVPAGNDVVGSYYMANGFAEGYFGMQVNSPTERRVLFSVWSPYQTDDPSQIPDHQKIRLVRKGADVVTNEFGNEGSGGQSFLRYNWVTGQTYQFLLRGQPTAGGYTTYTAYFKPASTTTWQLIASFSRPHTTTYLKSLYSFLENFAPDMGAIQREVTFSNQWVRTPKGEWHELIHAQFSADNTARKAYRMDYAGSLTSDGKFLLRNCGFFDQYTPIDTSFNRPPQHRPPAIDIAALP